MSDRSALLNEHDKAIALLKSLSADCDIYGSDHAWRKCRACLAQEELAHRGVKSMLRAFLAALSASPEAREPLTPEAVGRIAEEVFDEIRFTDCDAGKVFDAVSDALKPFMTPRPTGDGES